jgi:hypothetical protein
MSEEFEIVNAVIESATIGSGDRGFLDCWITLDYGGAAQGFGGYVLYLPKSFAHHRLLSHGGHHIFRCMEVAGVTEWHKMPGRTIRVKKGKGFGGLVLGIGHIVKDDWFEPKKDYAEGK